MKKLLVFFALLAAYNCHGQAALNVYINFDTGNIVTQTRIVGDTSYLNDSNWLYVDTVHYPRNQWQVGRPNKTVFDAAYSFPNAIVTDTLHPCLPNDTSAFILKLPKNAWLGLIYMSFHYKLDIDSGDHAYIEWSADTGAHWTPVLTDTNGLFTYYGDTDLSTSTTGWKTLSLYAMYPSWQTTTPAETYFVRFTLITDSSTSPREGFVIENILSVVQGRALPYYYRTSSGAEIDLILEFPGQEKWAIEIKRSSAPVLSKGFHIACEDIKADKKFVLYSGTDSFPMGDDVTAISLADLMQKILN